MHYLIASLPQPFAVVAITVSNLKLRESIHRVGKLLALGHPASKWQGGVKALEV